MAFDQSKFLARFVEEAREHCSRLTQGLLNIENTSDPETLNALFRSAHTVKGSSRMMKLTGVTELANQLEDVLDAARAGKLALKGNVTDALLRGVDALNSMLDRIKTGEPTPEAPATLCEELSKIAAVDDSSEPAQTCEKPPTEEKPAQPQAAPRPTPPQPAPLLRPAQPKPAEEQKQPAKEAAPVKAKPAEYMRINTQKLDDLIRLMGEIVSEHGRFRRHIARLRELERGTSRHIGTVAKKLEHDAELDTTTKRLLEEGAVLEASLRQSVRDLYDASLLQDHLVSDFQETSLKLRMQPLSTVFDPLRRTVRDLAQAHGKEVDFNVDGGETELDRKIIERIGDSLIHMIRNGLDHGIEPQEERVAAGKPPKGVLTLSAFYDRGCVTISLADDGRGLNLERIKEKALSKRLYDPETLAGMNRSEVMNIIFAAGFSTSPIITDLSGRGVGMDVVRKNIVDELKGTILIETTEGKGTTFLLNLPLNLAVFPLILVSAGKRVSALPATSLVEMLVVEVSEIIEIVNKRAIRLREQLIPVEDLTAILGIPHSREREGDKALIVIVIDGSEKLGLIIDEILDREEMVVKPLPEHLQKLKMVSGVTIGERNTIINVLHVPDLIRHAREITEPIRVEEKHEGASAATILVVDDSINTREIEKSILEAYGYNVVTAEDGEEAFGRTREVMYDLIVTDVEMPRLDGFSLTERLRADERYREVPIVIVTSREKDEDKRRGITVGANAYIVKGAFDQSNLLETVRSLIG